MFLAYRQINDLDRAKENLLEAIKLEPNDKVMRGEYIALCSVKSEKEKIWNDKMKGFYNTEKLNVIQAKDEEDAVLREKIKRQVFGNEDQ